MTTNGFNSLQTGKPIQSRWWLGSAPTPKPSFQFPSNGKAYPKSDLAERSDVLKFQFPSNGKAYPKYNNGVLDSDEVSIPFKRESLSKVLSRLSNRQPNIDGVSIPFKRESLSKDGYSDIYYSAKGEFQFPSNGKAYPKTLTMRHILRKWYEFQFPSNGKAYPKGRGWRTCLNA